MKKDLKTCDVENWVYSDTVKDHFFNPRNILLDEKDYVADGIGVVGSPACGDMMALWIQVDKKNNCIAECKWRTFGCASAIASTSMLSVMATEDGGMTLARAKKITPDPVWFLGVGLGSDMMRPGDRPDNPACRLGYAPGGPGAASPPPP